MRLLFPMPTEMNRPYEIKDYTIRPHLRREAVATAISIFEEKRDHDKAGAGSAVYTDLTDWTCEWLAGTLIQGAYIREYHSWEREVKSFLNGQCYLNGESKPLKWRVGSDGFVTLLRKQLPQFSAVVDERTLTAIEIMRQRVNDMKHTPTFYDTNLVSKQDYDVAAEAIADFWNQLMNQRLYVKMDWNEHLERYFVETK